MTDICAEFICCYCFRSKFDDIGNVILFIFVNNFLLTSYARKLFYYNSVV
jgi:hypothetical protein